MHAFDEIDPVARDRAQEIVLHLEAQDVRMSAGDADRGEVRVDSHADALQGGKNLFAAGDRVARNDASLEKHILRFLFRKTRDAFLVLGRG
jgi:hypothetical protein